MYVLKEGRRACALACIWYVSSGVVILVYEQAAERGETRNAVCPCIAAVFIMYILVDSDRDGRPKRTKCELSMEYKQTSHLSSVAQTHSAHAQRAKASMHLMIDYSR